MANLRNLNEDNVRDLENFFDTDIKPINSEATLEIFKQEKEEISEPLNIEETLRDMKSKIDLMFDEFLERQIRKAVKGDQKLEKLIIKKQT